MNFQKQRSYRETARLTSTNDTNNNHNNNKPKRTQNDKM